MAADLQDIENKLTRLKKYLSDDVYRVIGIEAVKWFKNSFHNQGFTDTSLKKWKDVKRRDSSSGWYGFKYGSKAVKPGRKKRDSDSKTNYSNAATKRPILSGDSKELMNSIQYRVKKSSNRVVVFSDKVYAEIQNNGGEIKVFGKSKAVLPARTFMGDSKQLTLKLELIIKQDIQKILR